jgi:hypothetical protein
MYFAMLLQIENGSWSASSHYEVKMIHGATPDEAVARLWED